MIKILQDNFIVRKLLNIPEQGYLPMLNRYPNLQNILCNLMLNSLLLPILAVLGIFSLVFIQYIIYIINVYFL